MKNGFVPVIKDGCITAIYDLRYKEKVDITDGSGRFGQLVYTLKTQDIKTEQKPEFIPYNDYCAPLKGCLKTEEYKTHLVLDLSYEDDEISMAGMFLPLNLLGQKNGTWQQQFTVSSPYHTADKKHFFVYLTRPDGNGIVLVVENEIAGYRLNYSPFLSGHYITGIQFLSRFDRAYQKHNFTQNRVRLHIAPANSYRQAMAEAAEIWGVPALYYSVSSCVTGQPFGFEQIGDADKIVVIAPSGKQSVLTENTFTPAEYGIHTVVPYSGSKPGMDCAFFVHNGFSELYSAACASIKQNHNNIIGTADDGTDVWKPPFLYYRGYEDFNLCEHAMWCWSLLRFMRLNGISELYAPDVRNFLKIMTAKNGVRLNCCTLDEKTNFTTLNSTRIQEAYNGVGILLDAYRVFGEEQYLELAVKALTARLKTDLSADGAILRRGSDGTTAEVTDYTTVTGMIIPIVDLAVFLKELGDERYEYFAVCAEKIADFMVVRGLDFPTEGGFLELVNREVEEGSMSCTVLTVLYVARYITCKAEYLSFAKLVLKKHDAFTVFTPHPVMYRSTLRWWETIWEGNADGPAVCYGHAWSVWRGEAEYWYALLCHDDERILDSYNCFMTNLAKVDKDGNMYSIYQYEPISSGALAKSGVEVDFTDREGFPETKDVTLSRYVFARGFDTWFKTVALLPEHTLGAVVKNGIVEPFVPDFNRLYIGNVTGTFKIKGIKDIEIISNRKVSVIDNETITVED